ncbi:MAG: aromatic amino acid lyase, partial [Alphaproteobacteria bacterium]|nr:aromatic amino acid lyase [Alphaproteobacteria bacterium]
MTIIIETREDFTLDAYARIAWARESTLFGDTAMTRMNEPRAAFMMLIDQDPDVMIYGVTSGYGQRALRRSSDGPTPPARLGPRLRDPGARAAVSAGRRGHGFARKGRAVSDKRCALRGRRAGRCGIVVPSTYRDRDRDFALSTEAFVAPLDHYDSALEALWGDAEKTCALEPLLGLLDGGASKRRPYQAPVSFGIVPRLLGRALRAAAAVAEIAVRTLRSITDNPVFLILGSACPLGRALSTCGCRNAAAAPALDELTACCADLALRAERQMAKILEGQVPGLPDQLATGLGDGRYFSTLRMAAVGFGDGAWHAAQRTFFPGPKSGGYGQNDVASNAIPAWNKHEAAGSAFDACLAVLGAISSQALFATDKNAPLALEETLVDICGVLTPNRG